MKKLVLLIFYLIFFSACISSDQRQIKIASEYLEQNPTLNNEIKHALIKGKIIRGMSVREALIAGGVISSDFNNISVWSHTGLILRPLKQSHKLKEMKTFVFLITNRTQFESFTLTSFSVFFRDEKVTIIEEGYSIFLGSEFENKRIISKLKEQIQLGAF